MNVRDIVAFINHLEEKYPVTSWQIDGIDVWPVIRFDIYFRLYNKHTFTDRPATQNTGIWAKRFKAYAGLLHSFLRLFLFALRQPRSIRLKLSPAKVLLLGDASYVRHDGVFYNRFADPVIDDMTARGQSTLLLSLSETYPSPLKTPAKFIKPWLRLRLLWASVFGTKPSRINLPSHPAFYDEIVARDPALAALNNRKILQMASAIIDMKRYFGNVLGRVKPKAVFLTNYYNVYGLAFCAAAQEARIPCVELQHGTQNDLHIGYGLWHGLPPGGFNTLPSHFASWDDASCATIEKWNPGAAILFGNRFLENFKSGDFSGTADFAQKWQAINADGKKRHVLLSLQIMFGFPAMLQQVVATAPPDIFWWIRFHPMMTTTERHAVFTALEKMALPNIDVALATSEPLYALLPCMDMHVTLNSSVVIEAAQFGVPSIVCDETAKEYYIDLIDGCKVILATSSDDVLHAMSQLSASGGKQKTVSSNPLYQALGL